MSSLSPSLLPCSLYLFLPIRYLVSFSNRVWLGHIFLWFTSRSQCSQADNETLISYIKYCNRPDRWGRQMYINVIIFGSPSYLVHCFVFHILTKSSPPVSVFFPLRMLMPMPCPLELWEKKCWYIFRELHSSSSSMCDHQSHRERSWTGHAPWGTLKRLMEDLFFLLWVYWLWKPMGMCAKWLFLSKM